MTTPAEGCPVSSIAGGLLSARPAVGGHFVRNHSLAVRRFRFRDRRLIGFSLLDHCGTLDRDGLLGNILHQHAWNVPAFSRGSLGCRDCVNNCQPLHNASEHGIPSAPSAPIQKSIVFRVDEELAGGAMGVIGASHGNGVLLVEKSVSRFVDNGGFGLLLFHGVIETTPLDHEIRDYTVENRAIEVSAFDVVEKVCHGFGSFFGVEFDDDFAFAGVEFDLWEFGLGRFLG